LNRNEIFDKYGFNIKFIVYLLSPVLLYWQDLVVVANEALNNEMSSHILSLPFLLGYILYRNRLRIQASASGMFDYSQSRTHKVLEKIVGILICLMAYLLIWYGSYTFYILEFHLISLPIFLIGLTILIFNFHTLRVMLFPILFLSFMVPPPIEYIQMVGAVLSVYSSRAAYILLSLVRIPVSLSFEYGGPIIYLTTIEGLNIPFAIDLACSGLYSLIGFAIFSVFTAYIARVKLSKKLSILVIGFPVIYMLNIFRIFSIVSIGYLFGPTNILNIIHLFGGWFLIFIGTLLLFFVSEKVFKINLFKTEVNPCLHNNLTSNGEYCNDCGKILEIPKTPLNNVDLLSLGLILIIFASLFFVQVPVFTLSQGGASILSTQNDGEVQNIRIFPEIQGYDHEFIYRDTSFEGISGQDASLMYVYEPIDTSASTKWVGLEIGTTKSCLHAWEVCLINYPIEQGRETEVEKIDLKDFHLLENPPLSARYFTFQEKDNDYVQVVLYWYTTSIFQVNDAFERKFVKISVIMYSQLEDYLSAERELLPIATSIANYWEPISSWSWAALAIARNGSLFIGISGLLAFLILGYLGNVKRIERGNAKLIYNRISDPTERQILGSLTELSGEICIESKIRDKIKETTGEHIDIELINQVLLKAEKVRLIHKQLNNKYDEPHLIWDAQFI